MKKIVFYFHVHQPFRLSKYSYFEDSTNYFDYDMNKHYFRKAAEKCYLPTNKLIKKLASDGFKCSFSISGVFLEQCQMYGEDVLNSFQELVDSKNACIVQETYHHSLSGLYADLTEFEEQTRAHGEKIKELFNVKPKVFRNTELLYNNRIAAKVSEMGFKGILTEGIERVLGWRSPNFVYSAKSAPDLKVLLRNYHLSDDIGFRFSAKDWSEWPLTADKYAAWLSASEGHCVNLFMDYESFGEHHWKETGIHNFLEHLPKHAMERDMKFSTVEEVIEEKPVGEIDCPGVLSWADLERDDSAWLGNDMQNACFTELQKIGEAVSINKNPEAIDTWRKLQTSDHLMYLCTKNWSDGDVHKYFSPYKQSTPVENYANYMNTLIDFKQRLATE